MKKIDLGCADYKADGYIGIDKIKMEGVDIVCDCENGLLFQDNEVDEIRAYDFLEHIHQDKIIFLMDEIWRILKDGGKFIFKVPDAEKGQGAYQDPTHKSFFVMNSFKYYENDYYRKLYNIKAKFKINQLEQIKYHIDYWGELYAIVGELTAIKSDKILDQIPIIKTRRFNSNILFTTDDVCPSNLKYFEYWDKVKEKHSELKLIAFTIANYQNKENIKESKEFNDWYEKHKDWVIIQPHGLNHLKPQLGWRDYETQKNDIKESLDILKSYLSNEIIYRFPGFRISPYSENILKELKVDGIAHQEFIKMFDGRKIYNIFNTHCCDGDSNKILNPITKIYQNL